jgi:hypothetical protein
MDCVIVNDQGQLYGGFSSEGCKPIWFRAKREGCTMDEKTADAVLRQLLALGFTKIAKRDANGIIRKWVPADLDASTA